MHRAAVEHRACDGDEEGEGLEVVDDVSRSADLIEAHVAEHFGKVDALEFGEGTHRAHAAMGAVDIELIAGLADGNLGQQADRAADNVAATLLGHGLVGGNRADIFGI